MVTILLVDPSSVVRLGLRSLIESLKGFAVCGEVSDGRSAVDQAKALGADVVILESHLQKLNGADTIRRLLTELGDEAPRTLAFAHQKDSRTVTRMLEAGATGFLPKTAPLQEITQAITAVSRGQTWLSPTVAGDVVEQHVLSDGKPVTEVDEVLTPREREVLQLLAEGLPTKAVAAQLHVSPKTVGTHRQNMLRKLEASGLAELVQVAIRDGLVTLPR